MSRCTCRHFQLHRSRVGSLAELSSPPGTPCLTLQEPILFPDLWYSGEQAYRIGQDGGICAIRSRKPFCHLKRWVRTSFFMREFMLFGSRLKRDRQGCRRDGLRNTGLLDCDKDLDPQF